MREGKAQRHQVFFWDRAAVVKEDEILPFHREDRRSCVVYHRLELIEDQTQQRLQLEGRGYRMGDIEQGRQLASPLLHPLLQMFMGALQVRGQANGVSS